jgi:hypothetical protein
VTQCTKFFTPPPYDAFAPVPGVTVRAIDKAHFQITNGTSHTYYVGLTQWVNEDNLVCGRGVVDQSHSGGRLRPRETFDGIGGSASDAPLTVSVWDQPCGDGCTRTPLGQYVVPASSVEPPFPGST